MLRIEESPTLFKSYSISQLRQIPQLEKFSHHELLSMEVVGNVLPFKVNSYVINELIDWSNTPNDPIFRLTFPQEEMLHPLHFSMMEKVLRHGNDKEQIKLVADSIRELLNPHPAGQMEFNIPEMEGNSLNGL